ncbi:MAG: hypothetical protein OEV58_09655 [Gammaproteobacteria bacterium]|nr:hypothetical protein [Gammaproteobacteria bacterium]
MILRRKLIAASAILFAMTLHSGASANNGIDKYEWKNSFSDFYVACLGEMVSGDLSIVGKYHEFDTPSGKYHLVDNWQWTWVLTGQTTGRVWFARGASPWVLNVGPGETFQYGESFVAQPISGDGPKLRFHYNFKVTVNANGELVVLNNGLDGVPPEDFYECFGK